MNTVTRDRFQRLAVALLPAASLYGGIVLLAATSHRTVEERDQIKWIRPL